ncbi:MAG: NAD(P)H-binding protein [Rhodospirillaceae bacterium]
MFKQIIKMTGLRMSGLAALAVLATTLGLSGFAVQAEAETNGSGGVLVFGGTGKLGSEIVQDLVAAGQTVTVMSRPSSNRERLDGLEVSFVVGDMLDDADMKRIFTEGTYRVVIDASAQGMGGDNAFYYQAQELISKYAKQTGVEQIIFHGAVGSGDSARLVNMEEVFEFQRTAIAAKTIAEDVLTDSGVPYTIIRHLSLMPDGSVESGEAMLSRDRTAVGPVTRDGLARLTLECVDNADCLNTIFHAVDLEYDLGDGAERFYDMYERVIKPEFFTRPDK